MREAYLRESPDLVHERKHACRQKIIILPLFLVPVELVDPVLLLTMSLEAVLVFPTSPSSSRRMEKKSLFVFLRDVVEEVVCNGELTVELLETDSIVLQEQESVLSDRSLYIGDQFLLCFLVAVELGQVDGLQLGEVVLLLGCRRRDPAKRSALMIS